jgi:hypothetical protein
MSLEYDIFIKQCFNSNSLEFIRIYNQSISFQTLLNQIK